MRYYKLYYNNAMGRQWHVVGKFTTLFAAKQFLLGCQDAVECFAQEYNRKDVNLRNFKLINNQWEEV